LLSGSGGAMLPAAALQQLQFAQASFSTQEGDTAQIPVVRSGPTTGTSSVDYAISVPGNLPIQYQATPGADFQVPLTGTVTFQAGDTQQLISIPIAPSALLEQTENFTITLKNPAGGATLGAQTTITVAITNENLPIVPYVPTDSTDLLTTAAQLAQSAARYQTFVTGAYQQYLQRQPDPAGLDYWSKAMQLYQNSNHAQGLNEAHIEAGFLDSQEYVSRSGGLGESWLRGMYHDLLGRDADAAGLQFWLARLSAGTQATPITLGFTTSDEALGGRVTETYQSFLGRAPEAPGLSFWLAMLKAGATTEDLDSQIAASTEYYNKPDGAAGNAAHWVRQAYLDILSRPATVSEANEFLGTAGQAIIPEISDLDRLTRFVPNSTFDPNDPTKPYTPQTTDWVQVTQNDSHLKGHVYVVAHGFAYGYEDLVNQYYKDHKAILKWWQTIDPNISGTLGPNASEMFISANNGGSPPVNITPFGLANSILRADPNAVVLAYSWVDESAGASLTDDSQSEAYTHMNGVRLAHALEEALPSTFHSSGGDLHLIGHSHGSKVATVAAVTLQRDGNANDQVAYLTIMDSPEDGSTLAFDSNGSNSLWYYLGALNVGAGPGQTFVDNYISYLDGPIGSIQGVDPLDTSTKRSDLQNVVDVDLSAGVSALSLGVADSHAYAWNWYSGAIQNWASNSDPGSVLGGESVLNPNNLGTLAGSYKQSMKKSTDPQFVLTAGSQTNTESVHSTFSNLTFTSSSVTTGSTYDSTGLTLKEAGKGAGANFTGKFDISGSVFSGQFSGISFNYQFSNPGEGDQLLIYVDTTTVGGQELHYAMTGTVAAKQEQFATLSLGSLTHDYHANIEVQLVSPSGSTGAAVTITNMQQFTIPNVSG
jgi:hypothetical protein